MSNKNTETAIPKRQKTLETMSETEKTANDANVEKMFSFLEKEALKSTFHETKGLRIAHSYAGKFAVNLANMTAKKHKDETGQIISAVSLLDKMRDAETVKDFLTIGRYEAYARIFGKKHSCVLSNANIEKALNITARRIFSEIAVS